MAAPSTPADEALDQVEAWFKSNPDHGRRLRMCVRDAIDEVIDTARTGRFSPTQLNGQEKTYIGTKIEILIRAAFELAYPGPKHKDYMIEVRSTQEFERHRQQAERLLDEIDGLFPRVHNCAQNQELQS